MQLFVYGTLKHDGVRHAVIEDSNYEGVYILQGYRLYGTTDFPIMVESESMDDAVVGELYAPITEEMETELDKIERGYTKILVDNSFKTYIMDEEDIKHSNFKLLKPIRVRNLNLYEWKN